VTPRPARGEAPGASLVASLHNSLGTIIVLL
jgi:hypothetical protein